MSRMAAVLATERRCADENPGPSSSAKFVKLANLPRYASSGGSSIGIGPRADYRLLSERSLKTIVIGVTLDDLPQLISTTTAAQKAARNKMLSSSPIIILTSLPHTYRGRHAIRCLPECQFRNGSKEEQSRCSTKRTQARDHLRIGMDTFTPAKKPSATRKPARAASSVSLIVRRASMERVSEPERDAKNTLK